VQNIHVVLGVCSGVAKSLSWLEFTAHAHQPHSCFLSDAQAHLVTWTREPQDNPQ
jgi:hypothetical protein